MAYPGYGQESELTPMVKVVATTPSRIRYKTELVTPKKAQALLDSMKANVRNLRKGKRDAFARDMTQGLWRDNGTTVKITPEGEMIDGLHRMHAVIKADVHIEMTFAYNVPMDAMPTIDTGSARTFGDYLKFEGETHSTQLSAVVKKLILWRMGYRMKYGGSVNPSHSEQEVFFNTQKAELRLATVRGVDARQQGICNATSAGAAFFLCAEIDYEQAMSFFDGLIEGENLGGRNPIHVARKRLIREAVKARNLKLQGEETFTPSHQLAMIINAWNFWREEEDVDAVWVLYTAEGKPSRAALTNENFPEPK